MLARFNQIVPNGAERIVAMAESQLHHRQTLEAKVIGGNVDAQSRGQIFAFILGAITIVGGMILVALNRPTSGLVAILAALSTLSGIFIYGRREQSQERDRKRREAEEAARQPRLQGLDE